MSFPITSTRRRDDIKPLELGILSSFFGPAVTNGRCHSTTARVVVCSTTDSRNWYCCSGTLTLFRFHDASSCYSRATRIQRACAKQGLILLNDRFEMIVYGRRHGVATGLHVDRFGMCLIMFPYAVCQCLFGIVFHGADLSVCQTGDHVFQ